ncbi:iron ABC transporter permease [Fictibacillus enclensis]|uniref:FecCD family ABC transporter permease n=1 Tax=Fictibacillus enclensis TaxID=1017270 RepID=UPI0024BFE8B8|nr:iron ABC transporter permease [Fictibacillus enclensis]MDM5337711.1 iron ABC transporter permease [Fictibacillus enclensis]WHY74081.1 iron ABC transporter permease [Fictibacillus enclensis]
MSKYITARSKRFSFLIEKKTLFTSLILIFITMAIMSVSIGVGELYISPLDVIKSLTGTGAGINNVVIHEFRLPRILIAVIAGASLSLAGAILQGIIRNPLASPDMLGITSGAGFAAVTFITVFSSQSNNLTVSIGYLPVAAVTGAFLMGALIYLLAWKRGISPVRLILIGVGLMTAAQALTTLMIVLGPIYAAPQATIWLTGTVYATNWKDVYSLLPWFLILTPLLLAFARKLNVQELGDDVSASLGHSVNKNRFLLLLISTALAGSAVAFTGAIGFVGLVGPHIARRLVGSSFGALLPVSGFLGAIIVLLADLAGRTLFSPLEVPAGVFTAAIGAPYFIYLLFKNHG